MSGALAQWRKRAIDFAMAGVMLVRRHRRHRGGVWLFALMRRQGQMDLMVALAYVLMLGAIGGIMLRESLASLKAYRSGITPPRRPVHRGWIQALPFKMRFRQSRLYISVIPPIVIGFVVGALSAIMGIGGGFIIVPAMIYILRMPTNVVMGTSLAQIIARHRHHHRAAGHQQLCRGHHAGGPSGDRAAWWARSSACGPAPSCAASSCACCWRCWCWWWRAGLAWQLVARPADVYSLTEGAP